MSKILFSCFILLIFFISNISPTNFIQNKSSCFNSSDCGKTTYCLNQTCVCNFGYYIPGNITNNSTFYCEPFECLKNVECTRNFPGTYCRHLRCVCDLSWLYFDEITQTCQGSNLYAAVFVLTSALIIFSLIVIFFFVLFCKIYRQKKL